VGDKEWYTLVARNREVVRFVPVRLSSNCLDEGVTSGVFAKFMQLLNWVLRGWEKVGYLVITKIIMSN